LTILPSGCIIIGGCEDYSRNNTGTVKDDTVENKPYQYNGK